MLTISGRPATSPTVVVEPAAQTLADALAAGGGPLRSTRSPDDARAGLDRAQAGDGAMAPAEIKEHAIPGGPDGMVSLTVVRPVGPTGRLPAVVSTHGGGWVLGTCATHERLVRDLAAQSGAAFGFVTAPRSPEARSPVAIEPVYATVRWVAKRGDGLAAADHPGVAAGLAARVGEHG
jgi:acetyl esterase